MKKYNVTAQVYKSNDLYKQTLLVNDVVDASSKEKAVVEFYDLLPEYEIVKIYSIEEI